MRRKLLLSSISIAATATLLGVGAFAHAVMRITANRGVDVVFEHVGAATWDDSVASLAQGGRLVTCGGTSGPMVTTDVRKLFWNQWSILGSNVLDSVSTAIAMDATVYASGEFGLSAIYPDGTVRWTYDTGLWTNSAPAIAPDGTIYAGGSNYILYALRPNGTLKWSHTFTDFLSYGPAIGSDGTVYIGCNDHNLYAFNPDGSVAWTYQAQVRATDSSAPVQTAMPTTGPM